MASICPLLRARCSLLLLARHRERRQSICGKHVGIARRCAFSRQDEDAADHSGRGDRITGKRYVILSLKQTGETAEREGGDGNQLSHGGRQDLTPQPEGEEAESRESEEGES